MQLMLPMLREKGTRIEVDEITLHFMRGGEYTRDEQPVIETSRETHNLLSHDVKRARSAHRTVRSGKLSDCVEPHTSILLLRRESASQTGKPSPYFQTLLKDAEVPLNDVSARRELW